jgi:hypothetical protein
MMMMMMMMREVRPSFNFEMGLKGTISADHRPTIWEAAEEIGISVGLYHTVLIKGLGMHWFFVRSVPRLLTEDQGIHHVSVCEDLLQPMDDESFLKNAANADEASVCRCDKTV